MTYTNPLNWVAMFPPSVYTKTDYVLLSSDGRISARTMIARRRTVVGTWSVEIDIDGERVATADWSTELRADTYVRHTLLAHGFTPDQIATFEKEMDEPELLPADTDLVDEEPTTLGPEWTPMAAWWFREYRGYRLEVHTWGYQYLAQAIRSHGAADEETWTLPETFQTPRDAAEGAKAYAQRNPLTTAEEPTHGTVFDADEDARLIQILAVHWEINQFGTRTLTVRAERGVRGLTVVAIEIPASVSAGVYPSSQWTLVVNRNDVDIVRETYTATATHMARIMRREYVRWSV